MGCFDSIYFKCEQCGKTIEAQSKGCDCLMRSYFYGANNIPIDVLSDINRHAPFECECGAKYEFEIPSISIILKKL